MTRLHGYRTDHFFGALTALRFLPRHWRDRRSRRTAPPSPELMPYLEKLHRDGIVVIPQFLPDQTITEMRAAVPPQEQFEVSPEGDRALFYADADRIPELSPFFHSAVVRGLARSYISDRAVAHRRTIGLKIVTGDFMTFEAHYHMDTWRARMKAFLYLEDVGPNNAPMTYLRGSHKGSWRRWAEAQIFRDYVVDERGFGGNTDIWYLGCFWPHEVAQLRSDFGYTDISCTGRAGTLVMFDGRGLHKATPLESGRRLILNSYWVHEGAHI